MAIEILRREDIKIIKNTNKKDEQKYFYIQTYGCPIV